jgi:Signal transduction histidine kinase involved in nitrogen fixation and metabolism regulation
MAPTQEKSPWQRRRVGVIALGVVALLLTFIVFSQNAFNLTPILSPDSSQQTLVFVALSTLILLTTVALCFVLARNLLKLFAERRGGVLGSKFRTKMVFGSLLLSAVPVIFFCIFAFLLLNRSIEKWFSRPVEELRDDSAQIAAQLGRYASDNAHAEAQAIAEQPDTVKGFQTENYSPVMQEFRQRQRTLQGGFALAIVDDYAVASLHAPEAWGSLRTKLPPALLASKTAAKGSPPESLKLNGIEYAVGTARIAPNGVILVALPLPPEFSATLHRIDDSQRKYQELSKQKKALRRTYVGVLLLLTILVLFATTWVALYLSKLVTRPVSALAEATEEISRGHLDYRIDVPAADELGQLVTSFNQMAAELETSRRQIESSTRDVADANMALDQRRQQMETILESIPTGVLSLDADRRVSRANDALLRLFTPNYSGPGSTQPLPRFSAGTPLQELFPADVIDDLDHLIRKADRMGTTTSQSEIVVGRRKLTVAITVAALKHEKQGLGYVIVFEDLSDLLTAQKQTAWREVARRVAHEIKNPLTPIALSAERIRRHLERGTQPDEASLEVIKSCAETIGGAVETVRELVDEFSTMARFPASKPQPADMNNIIESALAMFNGRLDGINVQTELAKDLPSVMADPEAMKRAVANLVDNAAEAMQESLVREIHIATSVLEGRESVELVIADTGHGVTTELKEKLFLPYFSTKKRGTGLGLAIVSRIIEDHHGSIRVEENSPVGARFIVEVPLASQAESTESKPSHA